MSLYLEALRLRPNWAEGWKNAGILLAQQADYSRASWAFGHYLRLKPKDGNVWALRGMSEFELRRYPEALSDLQDGRELGVSNLALQELATFHAALVFILKGDFEVAQQLLVQLARQGVTDPQLVEAFGLASLRLSRLPGDWSNPQQEKLVTQVGQIAFQAVQAPLGKISPAYQAIIRRHPHTRGLHYAFGAYLLDRAQYRQGLVQMQDELKLNPDDAMAMLQAAMAEIKLNQLDRALPYSQKAVRLAPELFASHYTLGLTLFRLDHYPQSLAELKTAVQLAPNSPQAHYALSRAYLKTGDKQAALREWNLFNKLKQEPTVAAPFPLHVQENNSTPVNSAATPSAGNAAMKAIFDRAEQDLRKGDYARAEAGFQKVLKAEPNSAAAYCDLGVICLRTKRIDQAIQDLQTAGKLDPKLAGIDLNLGLAYYQKKDFEKAIPEFTAVLAADPHNTQASFLKGLCQFMLNQYGPAVATLKPLWSLENNNLDYLFVLGISYGKLNRSQESAEVFQRLVQVGGDSPHFHFFLGKAYEGLSRNELAREELEKVVAGDPKFPEAHYELGVVDMRLKLYKQAGEQFDAEIKLDPSSQWSYQRRGLVDIALHDPAHAILMFHEALARDRRLPVSLAGIGRAYALENKYQEAVRYYLKALAILPNEADYHFQLGQVYMRLGKRAEAQREFAENQKLQAEQIEKQDQTLRGAQQKPPARP